MPAGHDCERADEGVFAGVVVGVELFRSWGVAKDFRLPGNEVDRVVPGHHTAQVQIGRNVKSVLDNRLGWLGLAVAKAYFHDLARQDRDWVAGGTHGLVARRIDFLGGQDHVELVAHGHRADWVLFQLDPAIFTVTREVRLTRYSDGLIEAIDADPYPLWGCDR